MSINNIKEQFLQTPKKSGKFSFIFFMCFLSKNQAKNALRNHAELRFTIKDTKKWLYFKMPCSYSLL